MSKEGLEEWAALVLVAVVEKGVMYLFNVKMVLHWHSLGLSGIGDKLHSMEHTTSKPISFVIL